MTIKNRITKLEQQSGGGMPEVIIVTVDGGAVVNIIKGPPELLGKTEAELDALYGARDDIQLIEVVSVSSMDNLPDNGRE